MLPAIEAMKLLDEVRRSTRQPQVLRLCDDYAERITAPTSNGKLPPKRDRAAYMREYRRKAEQREKTQ